MLRMKILAVLSGLVAVANFGLSLLALLAFGAFGICCLSAFFGVLALANMRDAIGKAKGMGAWGHPARSVR
jgi:hypothetical protein